MHPWGPEWGGAVPVPASRLSARDRHVLSSARRLGPVLRRYGTDEGRLAGWLLDELVTLAERLAGENRSGEGDAP